MTALTQTVRCAQCRQVFHVDVAGLQHESRRDVTCPHCRARLMFTVCLPAAPEVSVDQLARYTSNPAGLFTDIKELIEQASTPIDYRRRTFMEWWKGVDLEAAQVEQKLRAGKYADELLRQRLALIRHMQDVVKAAFEAVMAEEERRQKALEAQLRTLQLQEEIAQHRALSEQRLKMLQLEHAQNQTRLLNAINPPPPPAPEPVETEESRAEKVIAKHLLKARVAASAKQRLISTFLKKVRRIHEGFMDDTEKALRIRVYMETYGYGEEALPPKIRQFLERAERDDEDVVDGELSGDDEEGDE